MAKMAKKQRKAKPKINYQKIFKKHIGGIDFEYIGDGYWDAAIECNVKMFEELGEQINLEDNGYFECTFAQKGLEKLTIDGDGSGDGKYVWFWAFSKKPFGTKKFHYCLGTENGGHFDEKWKHLPALRRYLEPLLQKEYQKLREEEMGA